MSENPPDDTRLGLPPWTGTLAFAWVGCGRVGRLSPQVRAVIDQRAFYVSNGLRAASAISRDRVSREVCRRTRVWMIADAQAVFPGSPPRAPPGLVAGWARLGKARSAFCRRSGVAADCVALLLLRRIVSRWRALAPQTAAALNGAAV